MNLAKRVPPSRSCVIKFRIPSSRGALGRTTRQHVCYLISSHHPSLVLFYETHVAFNVVECLWTSLGYKLIFIQEARGHSGGIWVLSYRDDIIFSLNNSMFQAITFSVSKANHSWFITAVYASLTHFIKCDLWDHLALLRHHVRGHWLLISDMNEVLNSSEVSEGSFSAVLASLLSNMMASCGFIDMDLVGGFYTWRKNISNGINVRKWLDRCMADIDWHLMFPNAFVEVLALHNSDPNPLLLSCHKSQSTKVKKFHFVAAWISYPRYEGLVQSTWNNAPAGNAIFKWKKVQEKSLVFNKEIFYNIFRRKKHIEARLKGIHMELDNYPFSDLIKLEKNLQKEYDAVLAKEEMLWYQKSR